MEKKAKSNIYSTPIFNEVLSPTYNLSILVGIGRLSYFLTNPLKDIVYQGVYHALPYQKWDLIQFITDILDEDKVLTLSYKHVKIVFDNRLVTLVPNVLYSDENPVLYLEKVVNIPDEHVVLIDTITDIAAQNIYAIPEKVYHMFRDQYGSNTYYHLSTAIIKSCQSFIEYKIDTEKVVFLNIQQNQIHVIAFDRTQLLFYNTFNFQNAEDLVYYVLLVYEQLGLHNEKVPLYIAGKIQEESQIHDRLYQYIRYLHFVSRTDFYRFDKSFKSIPSHFFFDLYSLHTCA